jgi:hypothetical protein
VIHNDTRSTKYKKITKNVDLQVFIYAVHKGCPNFKLRIAVNEFSMTLQPMAIESAVSKYVESDCLCNLLFML